MYSDMSKVEILDKYRHINVDHNWWEFTVEDFVEYLESKGITTTQNDVSFSGFYSQGDGASYSGSIHSSDMKRFMDLHDLSSQYESAYMFAKQNELYVDINRTNSHYCHSYTMCVCLNDEIWDEHEEGSVRSEVYQAMERDFNNNFQALEKRIEEICRTYADELYSKLREEYEFLTSDAVVMETLEANEILIN